MNAKPVLKVIQQHGTKNFAIYNLSTGKVVEGGFFCKVRAIDYMHNAYDIYTGESANTSYTGR